MAAHDTETRSRLLDAATRLFAAQGFSRVTVRDICREADANVAAVNYHFGDKVGLYHEVLGAAMQTMRATTESAQAAGLGGTPEERLRAYVHVFLERVGGSRAQDSWIHQLMLREMAEPTPALDLVAERVIRPRLEYLASIVAEILRRPAEDDLVRRCVVSIQAQIHAAMPNTLGRLLPDLQAPGPLATLADHITRFSIAGVQAAAAGRAPAGTAPVSVHRWRT